MIEVFLNDGTGKRIWPFSVMMHQVPSKGEHVTIWVTGPIENGVPQLQGGLTAWIDGVYHSIRQAELGGEHTVTVWLGGIVRLGPDGQPAPA